METVFFFKGENNKEVISHFQMLVFHLTEDSNTKILTINDARQYADLNTA